VLKQPPRLAHIKARAAAVPARRQRAAMPREGAGEHFGIVSIISEFVPSPCVA
jgi:hypothetical protein